MLLMKMIPNLLKSVVKNSNCTIVDNVVVVVYFIHFLNFSYHFSHFDALMPTKLLIFM